MFATVTIGGGVSVITVENTPQITRWTSTGASHDDLELDTTEQGMVRREITGIVDNGDGTSNITLSSALPAAPLTVNKISWLELVRLGADDVNIQHFSTFALVSITTRTIQA